MSKIFQENVNIQTRGRGMLSITQEVQAILAQHKIRKGLCNLFLCHTSASLIICENSEPRVLEDLESFLSHLVPDSSPPFSYKSEGLDVMPAYVRTILTQTSTTIPIAHGKLLLGAWQGIYLYEHRNQPFSRDVIVTLMGD